VTVEPSLHFALTPISAAFRQIAFSLRRSSFAMTRTGRCCRDSTRNLSSALVYGRVTARAVSTSPSRAALRRTALHNTPFGDINASEDNLQPLVFAMVEEAIRATRLFNGVLSACEVNTARMADRANSDFLTVTELTDSLVRVEGVSFRQVHHLVSAAVQNLHGRYSPSAMVDSAVALAPGHLGHSLRIEPKALSPLSTRFIL